MKAYTVHAPPETPPAPERFAFVKDGFSWPALLMPVLWILWHRMWLTLMGYVIFVLVILWTDLLLGERAAVSVAILGGLLLAFEANNLRRLLLYRRGFDDIGASSGRDLEEAELRFFEAWGARMPMQEPPEKREALARSAFLPTRAQDADEPILGLFPEPER